VTRVVAATPMMAPATALARMSCALRWRRRRATTNPARAMMAMMAPAKSMFTVPWLT